ncbi:hydroxymethylglutaryl-CoA lyase [Donghicola eburneus]|uniref:Hydroxymethylglutaryl-CoA lyase, mitochondrial n=1 Tax=Donghicola eburneus TaxID=393278 RepID=A0A1M4MXZ3_9RHOB|nr:hydroxymethylglutaryl-CoA lyase [Donghicola eburneus]SCM67452.1 Hydroxymethylglutaryl-CoA lyase, mitochondrial [Donghicola eburneus]
MEQVEIFEVGPRDGLQNEKQLIPTADKVALVDLLSTAGFRRIEVASFVSPKWVPQMADSAEVLGAIRRGQGISYAALTPNMRGLEGAIAAKADEIAIFASASEGFSKANLNCTIDESFDRFAPVAEAAREAGLPVRGYVSCVTDCPYDGQIDPAAAARVVERLLTFGCYEVSLGDTIGQAQPERLAAMLDAVLAVIPAGKLAGHYHDTAGRALRNIEVSLDKGLRVFDAAVGGLGGCPYAPGAAGNVATEAVHRRLTELGLSTGLDPDILDEAAAFARQIRGASDA